MTTKVEVISSIKQTLHDWALGDIYKALFLNPATRMTPDTKLDGNAALRGAFILSCSLLDAMSCYYFNAESERERFRQFCVDEGYMLGYNADGKSNDLYYSLRCGMLHNYQPSNVRRHTDTAYALTHDHPEQHLSVSDKTICINLQNFVADVHTALDKFFQALDDNKTVTGNAFEWAKRNGWFGFTEIEMVASTSDLSPISSPTPVSGALFTMPASGIVYYREP